MRMSRLGRAIAVVAAGLVVVGCTGLPTSGPVNVGLALDDELSEFDPNLEASGPAPGASPEEIVVGFLEAGVTPTESWSTARQFLTPEFASEWHPDTGVTIDASLSSRQFTAEEPSTEEVGSTADVSVTLEQVAGLDEAGAYTPAPGTAKSSFRLVLGEDEQWRIDDAPDGIVLDQESFAQVYDQHVLQYFDSTWSRLVPDARWFPRLGSMATSITRAVIGGDPSGWLAPAVRTAFSGDVELARDSVPVDASQVAEVALGRAALSVQPVTLARMRTQLEASLSELGITQVRFTVDGAPLEAGLVEVDQAAPEPSVLVLTDEAFGSAVGDEVVPLPGITAEIAKITDPILDIDVAADGTRAAARLGNGAVFGVSEGERVELDARPGLIAPTMDPFGYTWTVPRDEPQAVLAWTPQVESERIAQAWPDASAISHQRIAADGTRIAAIVTVGGQRRIVVAAVLRDDNGAPTGFGEVHEIGRVAAPAQGLAWLGPDAVMVLTGGEDALVITQQVGGPASFVAAPPRAQSIAGAKAMAWVRVLGDDGVVYAQRGSSWQEGVDGILVLGTHAGL